LLSVEVAVTNGALSDPDNTLGLADGAFEGYDGQFDLPEPPPAPADFLTGYFHHPEWSSPLGERFMTDIRSPHYPGSNMRSWVFVVETDQVDEVTLYFTPSFSLSSGWGLWLRDGATGSLYDLIPSLTYSFAPRPGLNSFTILLGQASPRGDLPERQDKAGSPGPGLGNFPNPFNPRTDFRFNLPRPGEVEIRIFDLRGAIVGRVTGGVMPAGPGNLRWTGRDSQGREMASGVYYYRLYLNHRPEGPTRKMTLLR
jgi:hypothetical protein